MKRRPDDVTDRARGLRRRQTEAESLLWYVLRARRLCGLKFRRQHPIGPYFVDFACDERRLVIEIDGGYHDMQYEGDAQRQQWIEKQGWSVLRFSNEDVLSDVEAVAVAVAGHLGLKPAFRGKSPP